MLEHPVSAVKKSQDKKLARKGVAKSGSKDPADSTSEMTRHLRQDAESLLANVDRLLTRLS
jgi:hypothetical protein